MAQDITVNIDDLREVTLVRLTNERNARALDGSTVTPSQCLRDYVRKDWLDMQAQQYEDAQRLKLRARYKIATPTDQAAVDAILDKYRT